MFTLRRLLQVSGVTKVALAKENNIIKDRIKNIRLHLFTGSHHCKNPPFRGHYCNTSLMSICSVELCLHLFIISLSLLAMLFVLSTRAALHESQLRIILVYLLVGLGAAPLFILSDTSCFSSSYSANSRVGPTAGTGTMFSE